MFQVIEDHRPFDKDVSIETFFKRCEILKLPTTAAISEIVKNQTSKSTFVCRFQLVTVSRKKFTLLPILEEERKEFSAINLLLKTPKSKGRENLALNKTPNSLIKKFAASSLADPRPWMVKNADNSKLVLMRDITNNQEENEKGSKRKSSAITYDATPTKVLHGKMNGNKITDADISFILESGDESDSSDNAPASAKRVLNFEGKKSSRLSKPPIKDLEDTPSKRRTSRVATKNVKYNEYLDDSPKKQLPQTPSRKTNRNLLSTPKRSKSRISESDSGEDFIVKTPKRIKGTPKVKTPAAAKAPISKKIKSSDLTPSLHARHNPVILKGKLINL